MAHIIHYYTYMLHYIIDRMQQVDLRFCHTSEVVHLANIVSRFYLSTPLAENSILDA